MPDPDNAAVAAAPDNSAQTTEFVKPDGSLVDNWPVKLGEDFKNDAPTLSRFKHIKDISKSYIEMRKKLGVNPDELVRIPKDDSPDDLKLAWRKAQGWSENTDDYKYEIDEETKKKVALDDKKLQSFKDFAHKELELSPTKFKKLVDWYAKGTAKDVDDYSLVSEQTKKEQYDNAVSILKKTLGIDFDIRSARSKALLQKFGEKPIKTKDGEIVPLDKLFEEVPQLKNSAWMTIILDNIAQSLSEDTLKGLTPPSAPTPQQLDERISELRKESDKVMRTDNKRYLEIRKQLSELYQQKHGVKI